VSQIASRLARAPSLSSIATLSFSLRTPKAAGESNYTSDQGRRRLESLVTI
jgi:hypothetical protein